MENVDALIRPPGDVFYKELDARYAAVRRYLPMVLKHVRFEASPAGKPVVQAYDWLRDNIHGMVRSKSSVKKRKTLAQRAACDTPVGSPLHVDLERLRTVVGYIRMHS